MNSWVWALVVAILMRRELKELLQTWRDPKPCFNAYRHRLSIYQAEALHPDFIPKLGMGHVTLAGVRHHGMRNFEVWLQNMAPGVATPIHSHPAECEEINYVLSGSGVVRTQTATGLQDALIRVNSTVIAPPGTIWMVENTGPEDLKVLVVIGCRHPGISFFTSWNASVAPETELDVMPWNVQCPPPLGNTELTVIT